MVALADVEHLAHVDYLDHVQDLEDVEDLEDAIFFNLFAGCAVEAMNAMTTVMEYTPNR